MIVVKLMGGLGNQLFQYACGRKIAHDSDLGLKFDIFSGFKNDFYKRQYGLNHFNIQENFISEIDVKRINKQLHFNKTGPVTKLLSFINPFTYEYNIVKENSIRFNPEILRPYKNVYLCGYWQSEQYFQSIKYIINKELQFKYQLEGANKKIAEIISNTNSVSLHIRRLHGVSTEGKIDVEAVNIHGAINLKYYYRAVKYLSNKYDDIQFFVFSDDPEWVQKNIKLSYKTTIVNINGSDKDYKDLRLMSLCKHNIIANSSFSWWAAWLNKNPNKLVIAPNKWFISEDKNNQTVDLIPKEWLRI